MSSRFVTPRPAADPGVKVVLGPTNTGKTHLAVERMLGHSSGLIGLPLRLLAREIYDRIVRALGAEAAALITGEEKIAPKSPRYWVSTVEAMPLDLNPAFLAVDEVQLCADSDRGHVFTDRVLHARGREETMLLGSDSMRGVLQSLLPRADFISRPRFSTLTHVAPKKLSRLPRRSAVIAFSATEVYALAEMIRRQKGGAAVVMGALSPRTRNAQVALYQAGDVDYIVATDAIGMGLNMDVDHVAFASLRKFDGERWRELSAAEVAQIAGRAGRHMNNGTFGAVAELLDGISDEIVRAVENHAFPPISVLEWRNRELDFRTPEGLVQSLEALPADPRFRRAREAEDLMVLKTALGDSDIAALARAPAALRQLWEVCQIPDFRKVSPVDHARLCLRVFRFRVTGSGMIPADWFDRQVTSFDRVDGDIDTLAQRLAYVRTWTYAANRPDWLDDPEHWQQRVRAVEDRLSDALHERLSQRFVDRRTAVLMRELRAKDKLMTVIANDGAVAVEGHHIGALKGFQFVADATAGATDDRTLRHAADKALADEIARRVAACAEAADSAFAIAYADDIALSRLTWQGVEIAEFTAGPSALKPKIQLLPSPLLAGEAARRVEARLEAWLAAHLESNLKALHRLGAALDSADGIAGLARGLAYRLHENLGSLPRRHVAQEFRTVDKDGRRQMRQAGIWLGAATLYLPPLVKPYPARLRLLLWAVHHQIRGLPACPPAGLVTIPTDKVVPAAYYEMLGYRPIGGLAVRFDMLERIGQAAREKAQIGSFPLDPLMMSLVGVSGEDFTRVMHHLGYILRAPSETEAAAYLERLKAPAPAAPPAESTPLPESAPEIITETAPEAATEPPAAEPTPEPAAIAEPSAALPAETPTAVASPPAAEPAVPAQLFFREEPRERRHGHRHKKSRPARPAKPDRQPPAEAAANKTAEKRHKDKKPFAKRPARPERPARNLEDSPFAVLAALKGQLKKK